MPICNCNDPTLRETKTVPPGGLNGWDSNPQCLWLGFQLHELAFRDASLRFESATLQQRLFRPALQSVILFIRRLGRQTASHRSPCCIAIMAEAEDSRLSQSPTLESPSHWRWLSGSLHCDAMSVQAEHQRSDDEQNSYPQPAPIPRP